MKDWNDSQEWADRAERAATNSRDTVRRFLLEKGLSEHQAEQLAVRYTAAAWFYSGAVGTAGPFRTVHSPIEGLFILAAVGPCMVRDITIGHEVEGYEPYRPDFELRPSSSDRTEDVLIVELDGHEFHQKTKEQAEHDKRRDRWFAAQGIRVIRFTGSEVWRDVTACVDEAIAFFDRGPS